MSAYQIPQILPTPSLQPNEVFLIASGDLRLSTNQTYRPAQADVERQIIAAFAAQYISVKPAHPY